MICIHADQHTQKSVAALASWMGLHEDQWLHKSEFAAKKNITEITEGIV